MKRWDVFISHASEDKTEVAAPLANALRRGGVKVWLDRQELRIGDSLREKIDEGLSESRFGIVILSPHFFQKGWPKRELNGLMALEEGVNLIEFRVRERRCIGNASEFRELVCVVDVWQHRGD